LIGLLFVSGLPVPAGQFIPLVLRGGLIGKFLGILRSAVSPGVYAIADAAGLLSGVSRMTVWVEVLMIESTAQIELTIPILLSVVSSKFVSDLLMPDPLYERLIAAIGVRYLPPQDDPAVFKKLENKLVRDSASHTVVVVREVEERERIETALNRTGFQIVPFVTDGGNVVGTISRNRLNSLFAKESIDVKDACSNP